VPETVQIVATELVPNVNAGLGVAFDVAASATGPDPNTAFDGTVPANAIVCAIPVIVSVFVTGVVTAA
jgi:hypothetical protein